MKTNRIIALLLSVIFIFSVNVTGFAAGEEEILFEPAVYNETISLLNTLGIIDVNYYAEQTPDVVKRGEFAQAAATLIGMAPSASFVASFTDVPSSHPYAPYIYAMKSAGYMNGVSEDKFDPDSPIIFEQALSVFVKLAGYGDVALATGGYPTGYLNMASKNGILDNVNALLGTVLTKGLLLELVMSTASCDMLVPTSFGSSTSYTQEEGVNILSYYHKIYSGTGIVNADAISTMDTNRAEVGEVIIDGIKYKKADDTLLNNSVGRKVSFYYKSQSNTKTIIFASLHSDVREASFTAGPDLDFNYSTGTYTYEVPGATLTYKIGYNYRVIYNMVELYPIVESRMLPSAGTLTLIDNDDDGIYEVVIVDEFINIVADAYGANADKVADLLDSSRTICFKDYESYQVIDTVGAAYPKTSIEKYDIIEFYESADGKSFTALVKRSGAEAIVDSIDENYVYAGGSKYLISADVRDSITSLFLGSTYALYTNSKGELVYWTRGDDFKIGYVIDLKGKGGLAPEAIVKFYTTSGQIVSLPIADKVTNHKPVGTTLVSETVLEKDYTDLFTETNYREIVGYKLNAQGEVAVVYHPMYLADAETAKEPPSYPLYRIGYYNDGKSTGVNGNSLSNKVLMPSGSPILVVPPVDSPVEENCLQVIDSVRTAFYDNYSAPTLVSNYTGATGQAAFYMIGNVYPFVSLMIYHTEVSPNVASPGQNDFLITNIRNVYDPEKMENKVIIEGREGSKSVKSYEINNPSMLKRDAFMQVKLGTKSINANVISPDKQEIEVGDVVSFVKDTAGTIVGIALLFDSTAHKNLLNAGNRYGYAGEVVYVRGSAIQFVDADNVLYTLDASSLGLWVFQADKNKNRKATIDDFEVGDKVYFIRFSTGNQSLTIYKN